MQDEMYRAMWENSMDEMMAKLMGVSVSGLLYVGILQSSTIPLLQPKLEHLTCFLPGNLALGVAYGAVNGSKAGLYMDVAKNLTYSCWQMYERMPTGRCDHQNCILLSLFVTGMDTVAYTSYGGSLC